MRIILKWLRRHLFKLRLVLDNKATKMLLSFGLFHSAELWYMNYQLKADWPHPRGNLHILKPNTHNTSAHLPLHVTCMGQTDRQTRKIKPKHHFWLWFFTFLSHFGFIYFEPGQFTSFHHFSASIFMEELHYRKHMFAMFLLRWHPDHFDEKSFMTPCQACHGHVYRAMLHD